MKSKKFITLLFIALFVFSVSIAAVSAENQNVLAYAVESSDSIVYSGEKITVDLVIKENTGFVWSRVDIDYDKDNLTFDPAATSTAGTVVNAAKVSVGFNSEAPGKIAIIIGGMDGLISPSTAEEFTKTGKVISLTFTVKEGYEGPLSVKTTLDPMNTYSAKGEMDFTLTYGKEEPITSIDEATHVHTEKIIPGYAATCTATGLTDGKECTVCKEIYLEQEEIGMIPHTEEVVPGYAATCTETGLTDGLKCSVCSATLLEQEVIEVDGHDWDKKDAVASTCSQAGSKAKWTCKDCGAVDAENNGAALPLLDHKLELFSNSTYHWYECVKCDYTTTKTAHVFWESYCTTCYYGCEHTGGTATCTERAKCTKCYMRYGTTAPHTPGAEATCTEPQKCTECENILQDALNHDIVNHEAKAPTCTEKGNNAYETCSRCDYTTFEEIAALGHDIQSHAAKAATCTEKGYNAYETCSRCDYTTYSEIAATGHTLQSHAAKAPTCTENGYKAYETCKNCSYTTYKVQYATNHAYVNHEAKAPTCTEKGNNAYQTCENCDYTTFEEVPATGNHTYGEWELVKEPTHKETGEEKRTCSVCGDVETNAIPVLEGMPTWQIILIAVGAAAVVAVVVIVVIKKKKA